MDITDIEKNIKKYSHRKDGSNVEIQENDKTLYFADSIDEIASIYYSEIDKKMGQSINLFGNKLHGYTKNSREKNNPIITIKEYYGNKKIKSVSQRYSLLHLEERSQFVEFPIGTAFFYDIKGSLIKSIDYGKIFKFSYDNVKELLNTKKANQKYIKIQGSLAANGGAIWVIDYIDENNDRSYMKIEATSGKIIIDSHNVKTVE